MHPIGVGCDATRRHGLFEPKPAAARKIKALLTVDERDLPVSEVEKELGGPLEGADIGHIEP